RRLEVIQATILDARGKPLANHLDLSLYRHKRLRPSPWHARFSATWAGAPLHGAEIAGDLRLGFPPPRPGQAVGRGRLWMWDVSLNDPSWHGFTTGGDASSNLEVALFNDGHLEGLLSAKLMGFQLKGRAPIASGDYFFGGAFAASSSRLDLTDATLRRDKTLVIAGEAHVERPYEPNPAVNLMVGGLETDVARLRTQLNALPFELPGWLTAAARHAQAGRLVLDELALDSTSDELTAFDRRLLPDLTVDARASALTITPAPELKLPDVDGLSAQLHYAKGLLAASQVSARMGNSTLSDLTARVDFSNGLEDAPYRLKGDGDIDVGELYPAASEVARNLGIMPPPGFERIQGSAGFEVIAAGRLAGALKLPDTYSGRITPHGVRISLNNPAETVTIDGEGIDFTPERLKLDRVRLTFKQGDAGADGILELLPHGVRARDVNLELHQVPAERWLAMVVPPDRLGARGPVDGKLTVNSGAGAPAYTVKGALTLGPGEVKLGFLRSPLVMQTASVKFDGRGVVLEMESCALEGATLDFKLSVADFQEPVLRIDAVASRLDLEVMNFVRAPWSPKTPSVFLNTPVVGHVESRSGNFSQLPFTGLKGDFRHDVTGWRVYNLRATIFDGRLDLVLRGRAQDDWMGMKGSLSGVQAGPMFLLSGERKRAPIVGTLDANFDLWANTDTDFFDTLSGRASMVMKDGRLERFTLLSRLLGLIDLKNWLTAQVPDPRRTGVPFRTVTGDFTGGHGNFYTDNLVLDGPVIDMSAQGWINVGDDSLAMEIVLVPFDTVNWLVKNIPLVGKDISAASSNIVATYFRVEGPVSDPSVTPMPLISAAEMVKRLLTLPINILRPNTVK
ncbi:MAG: AsmA-like C-terminal domain-containing protein, partial [Candidatus Binataceae bacterium]